MTTATAATGTPVAYAAKELPYGYEALSPAVSGETMRFHHDKHYKGYVAKYNELVVGTPYEGRPLEDAVIGADGALFNNAAQVWNHEFFFSLLSPTGSREPEGELKEAIERCFGSVGKLKQAMIDAGTALFGSGWVWLAEDEAGRLLIVSEPNAGNPLRYGMRPLLCLDVWEHAYYLDYRNRRAEALANWWSVIDWSRLRGGF